MTKLNWKIAFAGGAVTGLTIGGFAIAQADDADRPTVDALGLPEATAMASPVDALMSPASTTIVTESGRAVAAAVASLTDTPDVDSPLDDVVTADVESALSPVSVMSTDSPDSPEPIEAPAPVAEIDDSPDSPETPGDSPDSPVTPDDSPDSPVTPNDSPDDVDTPDVDSPDTDD
ncbi:MAG TPA: hypothetical protein VK866_11940 [Acidimicrobiales bacterium]|nr:hypothetical protein [Acidimicrobiales bacterium]